MPKRQKGKGRKMMNSEFTPITPTVRPHAGDMSLSTGKIGQPYGTHNQQGSLMAMIVCSNCKHMVYSPVDLVECDTLFSGGRISRHCHKCGTATSWLQFEWHSPDSDKPLLYHTFQPDRV